MGLFSLKKKKEAKMSNDPVVVAVITNTVSSEIYQDILRQNNVRFICRQQGAGGYLKHLIGSATIPDYIYVKSEDYEQARELFETYIQNDGQIEILDSEED